MRAKDKTQSLGELRLKRLTPAPREAFALFVGVLVCLVCEAWLAELAIGEFLRADASEWSCTAPHLNRAWLFFIGICVVPGLAFAGLGLKRSKNRAESVAFLLAAILVIAIGGGTLYFDCAVSR